MHEMALTRDVVDIVVEEARRVGARRVDAVHIVIGCARDIVDDLFEKCFAYMARDTVAQDADLAVERTPVMVRCKSCEKPYHLDIADPRPCPRCGASEYNLLSGFEFYIDRIEVA